MSQADVDLTIKVQFSKELADFLGTEQHECRTTRWDWGEPDADGFYTPTVTVTTATSSNGTLSRILDSLKLR